MFILLLDIIHPEQGDLRPFLQIKQASLRQDKAAKMKAIYIWESNLTMNDPVDLSHQHPKAKEYFFNNTCHIQHNFICRERRAFTSCINICLVQFLNQFLSSPYIQNTRLIQAAYNDTRRSMSEGDVKHPSKNGLTIVVEVIVLFWCCKLYPPSLGK